MATKTITATVESVGSHWLSFDFPRGHKITKEELYPVVKFSGMPRLGDVTVKFSVDRYEASNGWTDWRIVIRETEPAQGFGDVARKLVRESGEPVVREWLDSLAYLGSRQQAFASALRNQIREERYNAESVATTLEHNRHELNEEDRERLSSAIEHLRALLALL